MHFCFFFFSFFLSARLFMYVTALSLINLCESQLNIKKLFYPTSSLCSIATLIVYSSLVQQFLLHRTKSFVPICPFGNLVCVRETLYLEKRPFPSIFTSFTHFSLHFPTNARFPPFVLRGIYHHCKAGILHYYSYCIRS